MSVRWKNPIVVAAWAAVLQLVDAQNSTRSGYDYVDPLIGTINGGELQRNRNLIEIDDSRPRVSGCDTAIWYGRSNLAVCRCLT
jgi:hypothetical protein